MSSEVEYADDGVRVYDAAGNLVGHFGHFETLADQIAAFSRPSTAYNFSDHYYGSAYAAPNVPRYDWTSLNQGLLIEEGTANLVKTNAGATADFSNATGWTAMGSGQSIANGVATLQSPNGSTVSGFECTLTNLAQNTQHSFLIRARYKNATGTANVLCLDLQAVGYDNLEQELDLSDGQLTTAFQNFKKDGFNSQSVPASVVLRIFTFSTRPIEIEFVQLEQKAYATSFHDSTRSPEVLTVPTAGVFTKGSWSVELVFTPTSITNVGDVTKFLWNYYIDANNSYEIHVGWGGEIGLWVLSGGIWYQINTSYNTVLGSQYAICASGDGTTLRFCVNGAQIASISYTEPVGALPASMRVGNSVWGDQANGVVDDLRISNRARTLAEHQAYYNSGKPQTVDDATTLLMSFDGTLQQTVRRYGLSIVNGEIDLKAPPVNGGFRLYDASGNLRAQLGQYASNKYGLKVIDGEIYSPTIRSGSETDTSYVALETGYTPLRVVQNGNEALWLYVEGDHGTIRFYNSQNEESYGYMGGSNDAYGKQIAIKSVNNSGWGSLVFEGGHLYYNANGGSHHFTGDLRVSGGTKYNVEETEHYGKRLLAVRESPEQKYVDDGKAQLENGASRIAIDPIFLECIEPDTEDTPWIIYAMPYADIGLYVAEIGTNYFVVREKGGGTSNAAFTWSLSATRKGHALERLQEIERAEQKEAGTETAPAE